MGIVGVYCYDSVSIIEQQRRDDTQAPGNNAEQKTVFSCKKYS